MVAVGEAVDAACRELGGNRCTAGSAFISCPFGPMVKDRRTRSGRDSYLGGNRLGFRDDPRPDPDLDDSRPDPRPVPGRAGHRSPPPASRALRPPCRSSDSGPSGRSQQQPPIPHHARWGPTQRRGARDRLGIRDRSRPEPHLERIPPRSQPGAGSRRQLQPTTVFESSSTTETSQLPGRPAATGCGGGPVCLDADAGEASLGSEPRIRGGRPGGASYAAAMSSWMEPPIDDQRRILSAAVAHVLTLRSGPSSCRRRRRSAPPNCVACSAPSIRRRRWIPPTPSS